ncbi:MAG: dTDP-4-dehydrorhamnose 3,5-epimerase [Calditrichaeota bacterium]|nr:dTDP-4-dehydrorhamnose 3,5-epimerase [Calditrichota bacterium]
MRVLTTPLPGVLVIEPTVFEDARGFFFESYHYKRYAEHGISVTFVQDNHSRSVKNTLRGLHYQVNPGQGKLVRVVVGEVFDVAVDIRFGSPTFGKWFGTTLSAQNKKQMYIPVGFAHGFCVISDVAEFEYKCTDYYSPKDERGILWNDPDLAIDWPVKEPILSEKDKKNIRFKDIKKEFIFSETM